MLKQNAEANVLKWKHAHMNIYHAQMQLSIRHSGNIIHSYKHSFNMSIIVINSKYSCGSRNGQEHYLMNYLIRNQLRPCNVPPNHRPACSLISQQCCHLRAGHDSPRNKELTGLHIAKVTTPQGYTVQPSQRSWVYQANNRSANPTKLGLSGHPGIGKG